MHRSKRPLCVALLLGVVVPVFFGLSSARAATWGLDRLRVEPVDPAGTVTYRGVPYRGAVEVVRQGGGLAVVNDVPFEDYVRGIAEMPPSWPDEALRAQAIAARTYALWEMLVRAPSPWRDVGADVCATDSCQVYAGAYRAEVAPRWTAAVDATAGQVLLWRGLVIEALYSASNGGRSTGGGVPWLPPTNDPDDAASPLHAWRWSAPVASLASALGVTPPGTLVAVGGDGGAGVELDVSQPDGNVTRIGMSAADFHARLNKDYPDPAGLPLPLPSMRFSVATDAGSVTIDGNGWGHGLGLNQAGALGKARRGMQAADILAAYYGGVRPVSVVTPSRIRVALDLQQPDAALSVGGAFRLLDGAGHVVAVSSGGRVDVRVAGPGVRVVAPADARPPQQAVAITTARPVAAPDLAAAPTMASARVGPSSGREAALLVAAALVVIAAASCARTVTRSRAR
jgi:stage II sporulation protein D